MKAPAAHDYAAVIHDLGAAGDIELTKLARAAASFFIKSKNTPVAVDLDQLATDVATFFPTPFAKSFTAWLSVREELLHADPSDEEHFSIKFRTYFDQIWTCWRQIVHFVPFILLAPLSRLDDELRQQGGKTLARAFVQYDAFYRLPEEQKEEERIKFEGQQCQLLENLVELFTKLDARPAAGRGFFFGALLNEHRRFGALFPQRYTIELKFIQSTRNRLHGRVGNRAPATLRAVQTLAEAAFLDVVAIMVPLTRGYGLYHIDQINETGIEPIAETIAFSGLTTMPARFRLAGDRTRNDNNKFVTKAIYLIDRRLELTRSVATRPLDTRDYCDLTPFIVERGRIDAPSAVQNRQLFALDEYRSIERTAFMSFMELAGRAMRRLPASDKSASDYEKRELADLLKDILRFNELVESLAEYIIRRRRTTVDFGIVRRRTWDQSKKHLESIVDVRIVNYDGSETKAETTPIDITVTSFDRELYVAPAQVADVAAFFASDKQGMMLIGGSGYGKTTLLASSFLTRLTHGDIAIFLSGRKLAKTSLKDILDDLARSVGNDWGLVDFDGFVRDENASRKSQGRLTQISIFIDAVNEYTSGAGAPQLLNEIVEFVCTGGRKTFGRELPHVRIIATCRSETWSGYRESAQGAAFDSDYFFCGPDGGPVVVRGFDEDQARRELYERYRTRYHLTKTPYDKLAPAVANLFRSPLMLVLFVQAYGTTANREAQSSIPRNVSYYKVFSDLRIRKLKDCGFLVRSGPRREKMKEEAAECLAAFALLLYRRLTDRSDPRDHVATEQTQRRPMTKFTADRRDREITPFRALLEIGLITEKEVAERDDLGIAVKGRAFTFFHDRYAEHELSRVFQVFALGKLTNQVNRDAQSLSDLSRNIERLIGRVTAFPVLSGALEHWFEINLRANDERVDVLIPIASRLSTSESGIVRARISDILTAFVVRGTVKAKELYRAVFSLGTSSLRVDLASALGEAWPGVETEPVREFIEACDSNSDDFAIETLADMFAEHANNERRSGDGQSAVGFVATVFPELLGLATLATDLDRLRSYLKFLVRFTQITIVTCSERPKVLGELRDFLVERFKLITDFIIGQPAGNPLSDWIPAKVRDLLREQFEWSMYPAWNNTVSCGGVNDTFFVEDGNGLIQRDILLEYVPYLCALHNEDFEALPLADGSPFLELSLRMLNYREYSVLGFAAYVSLTIAVQDDYAALRRVISTLMTKGTEAGRFVAVNLVEAYAMINPKFAAEALSIVTQEMLPHVLHDVKSLSHLVFCAGGIVELDVETYWPALEPILDRTFTAVGARADSAARLELGRELRCMTSFGTSSMGIRFIDYVLRSGYLEGESSWRAAALEMCAGMIAGHRLELMNSFSQYGVPDLMYREVEALCTQDVRDQLRAFGTRARWNLFFVRAIAHNSKLRYLLIKYMFCSVALCNSVDEWAKQMGTFTIEALRAYATDRDDLGRYTHLSLADIYAATPTRPIRGGGKLYVARSRR